MNNLVGKVAVVTGAASGIGRQLALSLAAEGCRLAISDINIAELQNTVELLGSDFSQVKSYQVDSSIRQQVEQFAMSVIADFGEGDIVIKNAVVACAGTIEEVDYDVFEKVINVNMWGVVYGCKSFLPFLKQQKEYSLVNISSINAMFPIPCNGPYNMSKCAVYGLNETLLMELKNTSVQLLSVHPGGIKTNISNHAVNIDQETNENFNKLLITTAESAAQQIIKAIKKKRAILFIGVDAKIVQFLKRISSTLTRFIGVTVASRILSEEGKKSLK
jgi:NAD(P)-dependent dehydrogenase (short-subunit alcohol dehydrogenase family)